MNILLSSLLVLCELVLSVYMCMFNQILLQEYHTAYVFKIQYFFFRYYDFALTANDFNINSFSTVFVQDMYTTEYRIFPLPHTFDACGPSFWFPTLDSKIYFSTCQDTC